MARIYQTRAWNEQLSPSIEEFEMMATEAYAHLPDEFRTLTGEIIIQVAEFPTEEIMDDLSLETPFDLLGLFEGGASPNAGIRPPARDRTASRSIAALFSITGPRTKRRWATSSPTFSSTRSATISAFPTTTWKRSRKASADARAYCSPSFMPGS